jgi:hypothetical protein
MGTIEMLKKIFSNYNGQTPSTGKQVEDAFNENFETIKELINSIDDQIVQLYRNAPVINLDTEYPKSDGYYDITTAIAAIPVERLKVGLIITYLTADGNKLKQFRGTGNYTYPESWIDV